MLSYFVTVISEDDSKMYVVAYETSSWIYHAKLICHVYNHCFFLFLLRLIPYFSSYCRKHLFYIRFRCYVHWRYLSTSQLLTCYVTWPTCNDSNTCYDSNFSDKHGFTSHWTEVMSICFEFLHLANIKSGSGPVISISHLVILSISVTIKGNLFQALGSLERAKKKKTSEREKQGRNPPPFFLWLANFFRSSSTTKRPGQATPRGDRLYLSRLNYPLNRETCKVNNLLRPF